MSTQTIFYLINAAIFCCIMGATVGICIFNWGDSVKVKYHQLKGLFVIVANGLIVYFVCAPLSVEYKEKLFLETEYSGVVVEKIIEKHNHNIPIIYINEFQNQKRTGVSVKKNIFKKTALGDTLTKLVNTDYLLLKNKKKKIKISKNQLITP